MFNVGTGVETSVNALAATIARVTRRMLHWTPQVTLESGIERTVEWFVGAGQPADAGAAGSSGG